MLSGRVLGVPVRIDGPDLVLDLLALTPPPTWTEGPTDGVATWRLEPQGEGFSVWRGTERLGAWFTPTALQVLWGDLELYAAEHTTDFVAIHAGVVVHDGRALLLPGRSLAGKSTLTMALLGAGATYYSDEYALLRPDGTTTPYARPLSMRPRADEPAGPPRRTTAAELGFPEGRSPASVSLVAHVLFDPEVGLAVEPLSSGATTLALVSNAVAAQTQKGRVLATCAKVAGLARGVEGTRGEADVAASYLLGVLSQQ